MSAGLKFAGLLVASALCLPVAGWADTQAAPPRVHKVKTVSYTHLDVYKRQPQR